MSILNNTYTIEIIDTWNMTIAKIKSSYNGNSLFNLNLMKGYVLRISKVNKTVTAS